MKLKKILKIIFAILLLASALVFIIYFKYYMNTSVTKDATIESMQYENYEILEGSKGYIADYDNSLTVEGYDNSPKTYYIEGKFRSKNKSEFILITFDLYDKNDNLITTAQAGINNVEVDVEYDFKAMSLTGKNIEEISYYKLSKIEEI